MKTTNRAARLPRNTAANTAAIARQMVRASLKQSERDLSVLMGAGRDAAYKLAEIEGLRAKLTDMSW